MNFIFLILGVPHKFDELWVKAIDIAIDIYGKI